MFLEFLKDVSSEVWVEEQQRVGDINKIVKKYSLINIFLPKSNF